MPLKDIDANTLAGRESRASSSVTANQHARKNSQQNQADVMSSGVMSMLRTTTDFGDLDSVALQPKRHRPGRRPSGNGPPLSRQSSHYSQYSRAESVRSRTSNRSMREPVVPGAWPNTPGLQQPTFDRPFDMMNPQRPDHGQRSYSLTGTHHPSRLISKTNRSVTSLQSAGPSINRPRSPYQYSARFHRPDLRPTSPAWSDGNAASYHRPNFSRPMLGPRPAVSAYPFPPQGPERMLQRPPLPMHPSLEGFRRDGPLQPRPAPMLRSGPSPLGTDENHSRFNKQAPAAPYPGFVQRVKNLLEERASADSYDRSSPVEFLKRASSEHYRDDATFQPPEVMPLFAAVELPATSPKERRLTRDMVRAALGTSSDAEPLSSPNLLDSTMLMPDEPEPDSSSLPAADSDVETAASSTDSVEDEQKQHTDVVIDPAGVEAHEEGVGDMHEDGGHANMEPDDSVNVIEPVVDDISVVISSDSDSNTPPAELIPESKPALQNSVEDADLTRQTVRLSTAQSAQGDHGQSFVPVRQSLLAQAESDILSTDEHIADTQVADRTTKMPAATPRQSLTVARTSVEVPQRPASVMEGRSSWATSIASRVLSEPETTVMTDEPQSTWARSIASRAVSMAEVIQSRPASATSLPIKWARSSLVAIRNSTLSPLPDAEHTVNLDDGNAARSSTAPQATFLNVRQSSEEPLSPSTPNTAQSSSKVPSAEIRFSALKQFQSGLPDLTEDSQEDASTTNLRMLGSRPPTFRTSRLRNEMRASYRASAAPVQIKPPQPASYLSRNISSTKGIPSLNFSSTDLTKAMNKVLGIRSSRSLESVQKRPRPKGIIMNSPTRAMKRDRYASYFVDSSSVEEEAPDPEGTEKALQQQEQLISEIEQISIPSVNALSVRLSELFPSIKKSTSEPDLRASTDAIESAIEEIRVLGSKESMEGTARRRPSVKPSVAGNDDSQNEVKDRTSVADASSRKSRLLDKELPPLPVDVNSRRPSVASGATRSKLGHSVHDEDTAELEAVSRRASTVHKIKSAVSVRKAKSTTFLPSSPNARPWNKSESFPWTSETPPVKLKEPGAGEDGDDEASPHAARLRARKSHALLSMTNGVKIARTMSPGPRLDASLIPSAERRSADGQIEHPLKKGLIGSISRKMGKRPRTDTTGFPLDPEFLHPHERLSSTSPGDRYPTTSLTPPIGLNIDETARSFFSDDSSDNDEPRVGSLRKRLTRLKNKRSQTRVLSGGDTPSQTISSPVQDDSLFSGSHVNISEPDVVLMMYDEPAIGMSKAEFHAKRLVEKIRKMWYKGGKLLRGRSHNKQDAADMWHEVTSVYDGV